MSNRYYATGRRKSSSARVWIKRGSGKFEIEGRSLENYFKITRDQDLILEPFATVGSLREFDVFCTVKGGGTTGQAGAIRLGISRALLEVNPLFRPILKQKGLTTRDRRVVERKKYGRKKARRRFQFCKR